MEKRSSIDFFVEPQPADIRSCWDQVREGIEFILSEDPNLTFIPEDVYSECVNGRAQLFTSPIGFLVLTTETDPFTSDKTLLIWIAYVYETGKHNWIKHVQWFNTVACNAGCKYIEARSSVPEMTEYAIAEGWSLNTRVYTRKVDE